MKIAKKLLVLAAGVAVVGASASQVEAAWPERPITTVVMFSAGGGTDTVIRTCPSSYKLEQSPA
ncbi:MAG: hypothetical protein HOJ67_09125 [Rhodospirillaceae bacterium]|nr:hypothetical protein [Rhodospirillaceae bacterium]